jgi:sortase A
MNQKLLLRISAVISAISGAIILASVLYPIASYEQTSRIKYPKLLSPISEPADKITLNQVDYTKASNWFVGGAKTQDFRQSKVSFYTLSIPKLKIENATVAIGGENLSKSLVQYPGTALPGKLGNAVVFGHSILPQFYNPKDYLSIFSTLPSLEEGDLIEIAYDGVIYKYRVETMFEVAPTDIQVLEQDKSDSFLTLVTCVPPGHPLKPKRLIVRARVVPLNTNAIVGD